jgi:hypothetical protein
LRERRAKRISSHEHIPRAPWKSLRTPTQRHTWGKKQWMEITMINTTPYPLKDPFLCNHWIDNMFVSEYLEDRCSGALKYGLHDISTKSPIDPC